MRAMGNLTRFTNRGLGDISPTGDTTGSWDTEIIAMSLTGPHPNHGTIVIRESPTKQSLGTQSLGTQSLGTQSLGTQSLSDVVNDIFQLDSSFDIWTEVSIDGGPFLEAADSFTLDITGVLPEPSSGVLGLAGILGLGALNRRHSSRR